MTTNTELYPLICEINAEHNICNLNSSIKYILSRSNQIVKDDDEIDYLIEVQKLLDRVYLKNMKLIESKIKIAMLHQNLDLEKVKKLPDDILYVIKSYLEPELEYSRKFGVLRQIRSNWSFYLHPHIYLECDYLFAVPKDLIMNLITSIGIGHNINQGQKKEIWLRMIIKEVDELFGDKKSSMRMDKLLINHYQEYAHNNNQRRLEKWYRFWLNITVFKKYRKELEADKKNKISKLTALKNKKIVIK
jgi:hypothetical protein